MSAYAATERPTFDFDRDVANFREDKNAKQVRALEILDSGLYKFILYGGAMGPGKSYFLRWFGARFLIKLFQDRGMRNVAIMLACEDYPSLRDRQLVKISAEFPRWMGQSYKDHRDFGRCFVLDEGYGGGAICFRNLDDPSKYQSSEWAAILVDELTKNVYQTFLDLKTRLRWPGLTDIECPFVGGSNPGGKGHGWVKQLWIDKNFPPEWISPIDYRGQFCYIAGTADDNPYLDKSYWDSLNALPPQQRKAFRYGDWNIFKGQAFPDVSKENQGYLPAAQVPLPRVWVAMAMDWGFGAPFSIGWYHTDADGRLYRFASWYGWNGTANEGLRLEDARICAGILEREKALKIEDRIAVRVLSPDCFQKKPNYKGGGQGPSTAEVFRGCGLTNIHPGDPDRKLKIREFRNRVMVPKDANEIPTGQPPMLLVNRDDEHFFRTISSLITDENDPEEIDQKGEDHCLSGRTLIITDKGEIPLQDLVGKEGLILSVDGKMYPYYNASKTRKNQPTVKLSFRDGRQIVCTPDHKFLTLEGLWIQAQYLKGRFIRQIPRLLQKENNPLGERSIISAKVATTWTGKEFNSIASSGNTTLALSPQECSFIISTVIPRIIRLTTWPWLRSLHTQRATVQKDINTRLKFLKKFVQSLSSETLKRLVNIAEKYFSSEGWMRPALNIAVGNVILPLPISGDLDSGREFVQYAAKNLRPSADGLRPAPINADGLYVERIESSLKSDVYCLEVDHPSHAFAVCGGIFVHNCFDEVCFMAMARPLASKAPEIHVKRRPPSGGSEAAQLERKAIMEKIEEAEYGGDMPW